MKYLCLIKEQGKDKVYVVPDMVPGDYNDLLSRQVATITKSQADILLSTCPAAYELCQPKFSTKPVPTVEYFIATEEEIYAAKQLIKCRMLPGSWDKKFTEAMRVMVNSDEHKISKGQRRYLWKLVYRYRRQIADEQLVEKAREINEEGS